MAFLYNSLETYEQNFKRWHLAKNLEAEVYKTKKMDEGYARKVFDIYFGNKKVKIIRRKAKKDT